MPFIKARVAARLRPFGLHIQQIDEKVVAELSGIGGKYAVGRLARICVQRTQTTDQHRHFRHRQREHVSLVDQRVGRSEIGTRSIIVAEAIGLGFKIGEGCRIGLCLRGVDPSGRERQADLVAGLVRRLLDCGIAAEYDQVGERDLLATLGALVEILLDRFQRAKDLRQFRFVIDRPEARIFDLSCVTSASPIIA